MTARNGLPTQRRLRAVHAEADASEQLQRFRGVFEAAPLAIGVSDDDGNIKALNPAYTRQFGYTLEDATTVSRIVEHHYPDPDYRATVLSAWQTAVDEYRRTGKPSAPLTTRMRCKDGSEHCVEVHSAVAENGEAIVMFNDVTAQVEARQAQQRAEAERAKLSVTLQLQSSRMPLGLVIMDGTRELRIREWNPGAERIFGYCADEIIGRSPLELLSPESRESWAGALGLRKGDAHETFRVVCRSLTKDGRAFWCEWLNTPLCDGHGEVIGMMSMAADISERVKLEERTTLWSSMLQHSSEGIMICDAATRILLVNAAFTEVTGHAEHEVVGRTPRMLQSGRQSPDFYAEMWAAITRTGRWQGELWNRRKSGEIYPEWLSINAVRSSTGEVSHYVGIFSDITARKQTEQRIQHLAQYDALIDLPNRSLLTERLTQLVDIAARENTKIGVLFLDLDRFKQVNDSMGHGAGDLLLVAIAERLRACVRQCDTVARMGGDEFVVLLPQVRAPEAAAVVGEKILRAITEPLVIEGHELVISASIGICMHPDDGASAGQLIRNADAAMYQAKSSGRNAYRFYAREMNDRALDRLSLQNALRRALDQNELVLHYQPQVEVGSGAIIGCEALMRWNRPGVGLVPPGQFIPIAEESGLIVPMGKWALDEAARQAAAWKRDGIPIPIAVNLSSLQFHEKGFVDQVAETIAAHALDPSLIELELTESIIIHDTNATITVLERLHAIGVSLSIDDFGTGYSSLNYLRRFPIDRVKIDKSFVDEIGSHDETTRVVRAIIALSQALDLKVLAEGVETGSQLAILRELGCDEIQGFLISRAVPARDFEALLRQHRSAGTTEPH